VKKKQVCESISQNRFEGKPAKRSAKGSLRFRFKAQKRVSGSESRFCYSIHSHLIEPQSSTSRGDYGKHERVSFYPCSRSISQISQELVTSLSNPSKPGNYAKNTAREDFHDSINSRFLIRTKN
jgi:hypothetical protein